MRNHFRLMCAVLLFGTVSSDIDRLEKALRRIGKAHPQAQLQVAYEAGPCGFVIARRLKQLGLPCLVAAPSLIPKQPLVRANALSQ